MDLALTEDQRSFQQAAREFLEKEVVPFRAEWDRAEAIDKAIVPKLAAMGFYGLTIPEEYGGLGGDYVTWCIAQEELARADSAVRGVVSSSNGLVSKVILSHGTEEQKRQYLPAIAQAEILGCFALTEPGTGSDPSGLVTHARRDGSDYLITGQKIFITNATWADICIVFARTGDPGAKGISAFIVPTDSPGMTIREMKGKLGLRSQATTEIFLDEVRVPASSMLGGEGNGFKVAMSSLDKGRVTVGAGCVGIMQGCFEAAVQYAKERSQFGRPIASFQLVQAMLADMAVELDAARLLVWRAADLIDRGEPFGPEAAMAKYFASEAAVRSTNRALQILGGYGYIDEYPVQKYMRDARVMTLYEGTSQIQQLLIGRAVTGISAFV